MEKNNNRFTTHSKRDSSEITAIILTATAGRRMIGHGNRSLLPYQNGTVIDYQMNSIRSRFPDSRIVVVGGFEAERVADHIKKHKKVDFVFNPMYHNSMSTLSLYSGLLTSKGGHTLFVHGDLIFSQSAIPDKLGNYLVQDTRSKIAQDELGLNIPDKCVTSVSFGLNDKWGQIGMVEASYLDRFKRLCSEYNVPLFACMTKFCAEAEVLPYENPRSVLVEVDSIKDLP